MPSGGWGIYQVTVGGQTATYTIVANDYLSLPIKDDPVINLFPEVKESEQQEVNPLIPVSIQRTNHIKDYAAVLQRNFRMQQKK
jgi:hypothetical protein